MNPTNSEVESPNAVRLSELRHRHPNALQDPIAVITQGNKDQFNERQVPSIRGSARFVPGSGQSLSNPGEIGTVFGGTAKRYRRTLWTAIS